MVFFKPRNLKVGACREQISFQSSFIDISDNIRSYFTHDRDTLWYKYPCNQENHQYYQSNIHEHLDKRKHVHDNLELHGSDLHDSIGSTVTPPELYNFDRYDE